MSEPLQYACDEHGWCDYSPCPKCPKPSELVPVSGSDALVDRTISVLCDVAQLLDGWHNDGTVWSEWDEGVRKQVGELAREFWALRQQND